MKIPQQEVLEYKMMVDVRQKSYMHYTYSIWSKRCFIVLVTYVTYSSLILKFKLPVNVSLGSRGQPAFHKCDEHTVLSFGNENHQGQNMSGPDQIQKWRTDIKYNLDHAQVERYDKNYVRAWVGALPWRWIMCAFIYWVHPQSRNFTTAFYDRRRR